MSTHTVNGVTADDGVYCFGNNTVIYANVRANSGGGLTLGQDGGTVAGVGQSYDQIGPGSYLCEEAFIAFDLSGIPDGSVGNVRLELFGASAVVDPSVLEARLHDWGAAVTTADYVPGADLSGKTLLATLDTAGWANGAYNQFVAQDAFLTAIRAALGGTLRLIICSKNMTDNVAPTGQEVVAFRTGEHASPPRLVFDLGDVVTQDVAIPASTSSYAYSNSTYTDSTRGLAGALGGSIPDRVGQSPSFIPAAGPWIVREGFLSFNVSSINLARVTAAKLRFRKDGQGGFDPTYNFTLQCRLFDWGGGTASGADWQDPTELAALPLLASVDSADLVDDTFVEMTLNGTELLDAVVAGTTRFVLHNENHLNEVQPTNVEEIWFSTFGAATPAFELVVTVEVDAIDVAGAQPSASGGVAVRRGKILSGNQPAASGGIAPALAYGAPGRGRRLPIPAGTARVTTPRPASGSIRTRRDGVL